MPLWGNPTIRDYRSVGSHVHHPALHKQRNNSYKIAIDFNPKLIKLCVFLNPIDAPGGRPNMPNLKSAKKRLRQSERCQARNLPVQTRVKTTRKKLFESIASGDAEASSAAYRTYCSVLDKATKKGVIKKNTATRRKQRASSRIKALLA